MAIWKNKSQYNAFTLPWLEFSKVLSGLAQDVVRAQQGTRNCLLYCEASSQILLEFRRTGKEWPCLLKQEGRCFAADLTSDWKNSDIFLSFCHILLPTSQAVHFSIAFLFKNSSLGDCIRNITNCKAISIHKGVVRSNFCPCHPFVTHSISIEGLMTFPCPHFYSWVSRMERFSPNMILVWPPT